MILRLRKQELPLSEGYFFGHTLNPCVVISPNNATCGYEFFFTTIGMVAYIKTNGWVYAFGILRHFCMIFFRRTQEETIQMMICKRYYIHVENLEKLYYDFF
jgi:hypothetical protein